MTLKNRLSVTTLLALISLSSGALAQPVLATTKPTYGHLRANYGVTIYPRLPPTLLVPQPPLQNQLSQR
ncbi:hypothetical protein ACN677_14045 [Lactiplantibacillus paraplantarum]|uniref:hypothetical protein n=1 Tax=Lactiplantibacillus paraplantarum TaxID=60520 RepID=UPI0005143A8E|nr:hypothetical protein [Lactiplantibacillus paraplantarum]ALO03743.1 hypothetical protein ASU28_04910 [Lactiplantibacillus paraplantarum]KGE76508.1 hypothetical protein HR47_01060 [Lactiplantibacillus paraplantarum]